MSTETLITKQEAADYMGVSLRTVRKWGTRKKLPRVMVRGEQFHTPEQVTEFIERHTVAA